MILYLTTMFQLPTLPEGVPRSFRTGRLERELQMLQLSDAWCSCIVILWVNLASLAAMTLCVASQRVFIVVSLCFVIDSIRKRLDTPSYSVEWRCGKVEELSGRGTSYYPKICVNVFRKGSRYQSGQLVIRTRFEARNSRIWTRDTNHYTVTFVIRSNWRKTYK